MPTHGSSASGRTILPEAPPADRRWHGHPIASTFIRIVAVSVPLLASVVSGVTLSRVLHRPSGIPLTVGWWLAIMAASTVVLVVVDHVARRMLPLATLLKLSMAFPDRAPSRFRVAARAGTTRSLQEQLRRAEHAGVNDEPSQAAYRILMLVGALGAHDRRTRGHSERVRAFNDLIAEEMRLPEHDRDRLRWAALLHDIGKLHVPTTLLNKPKKPTPREWEVLKSHPARGARISAPLLKWLGSWGPTIVQHHERWDGTGYPNGLKGEEICLGARIVAVADAYEVMTAPRPYSRPVSAAAARAELARCAGTQFDPEVVRAFLSISIGKLRKVIGPISWLAQLPIIGATPRLEAAVGMAGRQIASVAATATGTGVVAAAMLPHAAEAHTHAQHIATAHSHHHHHHPGGTSAVHHGSGQQLAGTPGAVITSASTSRTSTHPSADGATTAPGSTGSSTGTSPQGPGSVPSGSTSGNSTDTSSPTPSAEPTADPTSAPPPPTGSNPPPPSSSPSPSPSASGSDPQPGHGKDHGN